MSDEQHDDDPSLTAWHEARDEFEGSCRLLMAATARRAHSGSLALRRRIADALGVQGQLTCDPEHVRGDDELVNGVALLAGKYDAAKAEAWEKRIFRGELAKRLLPLAKQGLQGDRLHQALLEAVDDLKARAL